MTTMADLMQMVMRPDARLDTIESYIGYSWASEFSSLRQVGRSIDTDISGYNYYNSRGNCLRYTKSLLRSDNNSVSATRTHLLMPDAENPSFMTMLCAVDKRVNIEDSNIGVSFDISASPKTVKLFLSNHGLDTSEFGFTHTEFINEINLVLDRMFLIGASIPNESESSLLQSFYEKCKSQSGRMPELVNVSENISEVARAIVHNRDVTKLSNCTDIHIKNTHRRHSKFTAHQRLISRGPVDQLYSPDIAMSMSYLPSIFSPLSTVCDSMVALVDGTDTMRVQTLTWSLFDNRILDRAKAIGISIARLMEHDTRVIATLCDEVGDAYNLVDVVYEFSNSKNTTFLYVVEVLPDARIIVTPAIQDKRKLIPVCSPYSSFAIDAAYIAALSPTFTHARKCN